jgi:hypothetical protein
MLAASIVPVAQAQNAGTDPVKKLCMVNISVLGLPSTLVTAVNPTASCPLLSTEIQAIGTSHSAQVDATGAILVSDGAIRLVSHVPDSGIWVYELTLPPGAVDANLTVSPAPEQPIAGDADNVTTSVQEVSNDGSKAEFQVLAWDVTANTPLPDHQERMVFEYQYEKTVKLFDFPIEELDPAW